MNETAVRHTNRFLADLMATMKSTAEAARRDTLEQCRSDVDEYAGLLRTRAADAAAEMRTAADADIEVIREWSRAEMERVRLETEARIAGRGEDLERDLGRYEAAIEAEIERANERVRVFETDVAAFCERLMAENDPAAFASLASQMPEPPEFDANEAPVPEPEPEVEAAAEQAEPATAEPAPEGADAAAEQGSEAEQTAAEDAAEAAPTEETRPEEAPADEASAADEAPAADEASADEALAAAEADAEPDAAADVEPAAGSDPEASAVDEMGDETIEARLAGLRSVPRTSNGESTRVVVVGLVSVASIATFKRQLSRLPGVRSVGVSSGPDGEFVFTAAHATDTSLGSLITALPGFQARVVSQQDGVLNISAHDPEA